MATEPGVPTLDDVRAAAERLPAAVLHTPLVPVSWAGGELRVKAESLQPVGSFKLRGALNRLLTLPPEVRARGVVAHSSGNHAQAVAYAARLLGVPATIVMPDDAPVTKLDATRSLGAEVVIVGPDSSERAQRCAELAAERDLAVAEPYDDPAVLAGAGTIGLEILDDWPEVELVLVPVSGGGLLGGISTAVKALRPDVAVWGVEPAVGGGKAARSLATGERVAVPAAQASSTIADGLRVRQLGTCNWEAIRRNVDGIVGVSEDEIIEAVRALARGARLVAEPSGAVATAGWLFHRDELPPVERVVAAVSGGNVDPGWYAAVLGR